MYFARRSLITMLLVGILLSACGATPAGQPTPDVNATIAAGAETLAAALFLTQTAIAPTATYTPLPTLTSLPTPTPLALPTSVGALPTATQGLVFFATPTPTGTFYTSTPLGSSLAVGCSNMALIRDVTIPSGTVLKPGESFTKTWQVANTGTCDWLFGYSLVHASGDRMSGNGYRLSQRINVPVPPKEWRQISVELEAPSAPGKYNATWRLANGDGQMFGASLGVSIEVKRDPDPTRTPTAPAATPNLQQTADAANTAAVAQQATQTKAAFDATANAVCATQQAQTPPTPCE